MRKRLTILIIGATILLVLGGFALYQYLQQDEPKPVTAQQEHVERISTETSEEYLDAEGKIVPTQFAYLSFSTGGIVKEILVDEGDSVIAGAPLVRLDTIDQEISLEKEKAREQQTLANLSSAKTDLLAAQAGLEASQLAEKAANAELALLQAEATEETVALARQNVAVAQAVLDQAIAEQAQLLEGATGAEIDAVQAQIAHAQAEELVAQIEFDQADQNKADSDTKESLQLKLNAAISAYWAAQAELDELLAGP
ncbi:MAG: hypothetical protein JXA42_06060, partial [Anaerolineales bacterium]|nr:hypothetical protein [Anaerolineales bacterium]